MKDTLLAAARNFACYRPSDKNIDFSCNGLYNEDDQSFEALITSQCRLIDCMKGDYSKGIDISASYTYNISGNGAIESVVLVSRLIKGSWPWRWPMCFPVRP